MSFNVRYAKKYDKDNLWVDRKDLVAEVIRDGTKEGASKNCLIDTFRSLHPEAEDVGTHHRFKGNTNGKRIDYIFVSRDIQAMTAEAVRHHHDGVYPSDHFPVTAVLRFKDTP